MGAIITQTGVNTIATKQASGQPLKIENFVFAYIDGLDPNATPPKDEVMPPAAAIKYTAAVTRAGYVNAAQVVYSIIVGSDVGDWSFNWIGLQDSDGQLFAVAYLPTQQKVKNIPPSQIGNTITRNLLIDHRARINAIRAAAKRVAIPVAIMLDTKGPEMRLGCFKNGKASLKKGQPFTLVTEELVGDETTASINHQNLPQEVQVGNKIRG